jgi:hypothetical protein
LPHPVRDWWSQCSVERAGLSGRPAPQLCRLPMYTGCSDITGMFGNIVLVNSGLHTHTHSVSATCGSECLHNIIKLILEFSTLHMNVACV